MRFLLTNFTGAKLSAILIAGIVLLWAVYVGLVLLFSLELPRKFPRVFSWHCVVRAAFIGAALILTVVGVMTIISRWQSGPLEVTTEVSATVALLLTCVLGTLGLASEASLAPDLIPVFRRPGVLADCEDLANGVLIAQGV